MIVPVLLRGLSDRLPNVRLSAARVADDILSVAAISSWPPPGGRDGAARHGDSAEDGCGCDGVTSPDVPVALASTPAVVDADGDDDFGDGGGGDNFVVITAEPAAQSEGRGGSRGGGGEWWGCGWEEVERRLEVVSAQDPDRDASYFATQALKPKWIGDSPRRV